MARANDLFRRQLTLAAGAAVALLVVLTASPPVADLYAPRPGAFSAVRALRAGIGPAGSALHPRGALILLPELPELPPGCARLPLLPGRGLSRSQAIADLLTGAPAELHGIALDAPLERIAVETILQAALARGLVVSWTGPREWGAPPGADRERLEGPGAPGREDRLVSRFLAALDRPALNLHILALPPTADPAADRRRAAGLLAALAPRPGAERLFALAVPYAAHAPPALAVLPAPPPSASPAAPADPLDVAPTLAGALGLPAPAAAAGRPLAAAFADPARLADRRARDLADGARLLAALGRDLALDASRVTSEALLHSASLESPNFTVRTLFDRALDKRDIGARLLARSLAASLAVLAVVGLFLLAVRGRLAGGLPVTLLHLALLLPVTALALPRGGVSTLLSPAVLGPACVGMTLLSLLFGATLFLARAWFALPAGRRGDPAALARALDDGLAAPALAAALLTAFHLFTLLDAKLLALRFPDAGTLRTYLLVLHALHGALLALLLGAVAALVALYAAGNGGPRAR